MKKSYYLGLDIGGTKCAVLAGTDQMEILDRVQFATETERGPGYALGKLFNASESMIGKFGGQNLKAIGISCGGPLDSRRGIIQSPPNLPGWDDIEIVKMLEEKFSVPVFLQNDANACALAEWRFGAGKGVQNMIFLTFGSGMGAGLILAGRLYTGTNDLGGEVGHVRLEEDGPEGFGKKGSFEGFCSGNGIPQLARQVIRKKMERGERPAILDRVKDLDRLTTKELAEAANGGDETALEIFGISGTYLGKGLSILIDILNPDRIVVGSVYARNPHLFDEACSRVIEREAIPSAGAVCEVVPAALGDKVGDYASLSVAMNRQW
jgi:glucokinase